MKQRLSEKRVKVRVGGFGNENTRQERIQVAEQQGALYLSQNPRTRLTERVQRCLSMALMGEWEPAWLLFPFAETI